MPRDMFTEELFLENEERHVYTPGIPDYDESLPKLLLDTYSAVENPSEEREKLIQEFSGLLEANTEANFEHRGFLEKMLMEAKDHEEFSYLKDFDDFFSPLFQALYNRGYTRIFIDLNAVEQGLVVDGIGSSLKGTEDEPLVLMARGVYAVKVGKECEHCFFGLNGQAMWVGGKARDSTFVVYGLWGTLEGESGCSYHVEADDWFYIDLVDEITDISPERAILRELKERDFFKKGNRLYFPTYDDDKEWYEATP